MWLIEQFYKWKINRLCRQMYSTGKNIYLTVPFSVSAPELISIGDYSKILGGFTFIGTKGKLRIGDYTEISTDFTVVTDNHTPTVGIPYTFTGSLHINDKSQDIEVSDDCWIGTRVTLLPGSNIGRDSVIGACSLVNKPFPPYAVIAGIPAKIIGVKFDKAQILAHEQAVYPPSKRLSMSDLDNLFNTYYHGMKVLGTASISDVDKRKYESKLQEIGISPKKFIDE